MKQITKDYAKKNRLKLIRSVSGNDMSKIILAIERLKEDKTIRYYTMDMILFNQLTHKGEISVSFWGENK